MRSPKCASISASVSGAAEQDAALRGGAGDLADRENGSRASAEA